MTGIWPFGLAVALIPARASRRLAVRVALCLSLLAFLGSMTAWSAPVLVGVADLAPPDPLLEERAVLRLWLRLAERDLLVRGGGVRAREDASSEPTPSP